MNTSHHNFIPANELLKIFPESIEEGIINQKIKEWQGREIAFTELVKKKVTFFKRNAPDEYWFWKEWLKVSDVQELLRIKDHIRRLKRLLAIANNEVRKGQITEVQIEQARSIPIEDFIGDRQVRKNGRTLSSLCPLHNEKTPSFFIYPESNSFFCFGCHQGGDSVHFVKLLHGFSFIEAVKYLIGEKI